MVLDLTPRDICTVKDSLPRKLGRGSFLVRSDTNKQYCAVGWLLHNCGVPDSELVGFGAPGFVAVLEGDTWFDGWRIMKRVYGLDPAEVLRLINANDDIVSEQPRRDRVIAEIDRICEMRDMGSQHGA